MQGQATLNACHCPKRFPLAHVLPTLVADCTHLKSCYRLYLSMLRWFYSFFIKFKKRKAIHVFRHKKKKKKKNKNSAKIRLPDCAVEGIEGANRVSFPHQELFLLSRLRCFLSLFRFPIFPLNGVWLRVPPSYSHEEGKGSGRHHDPHAQSVSVSVFEMTPQFFLAIMEQNKKTIGINIRHN